MTTVIPSAILLLLKIFFLVGIVLYNVFAIVLVRQEQLMADVLEESFEPMIRLLVIIHLVAAIGIFILAIFLI